MKRVRESINTDEILGVEENRRWGPLLPSEEWHNVLCANEFSGTDLVFRSSDDPRNQMDFHLVSTAVATPQVTPKFPKVAVIVAPTSEAHNAIADEIKSQLEILGVQECDVTNLSPTPSTPSEESFCIFLREIEENFLEQMNEKEFEGLQHLVKAGMGLIWAVPGQSSEKPQADVVVGLSRCIRSEKSDIRFITLALQDTKDVKRVAQQITKVFRNTFDTISETCESEYEERNNLLCINRVVENNILNEFIFSKTRPQKSALKKFGLKGQALKLEVGSPGLLDSMVYIEDPEVREPLAEDEVQVKVSAIGINFKDILIALGRLSEGGLGNECAGVVTRAGKEATSLRSGDRVVVTALGAYKTYVRSKALTVFKIPENMSFSEAAALPVVFCTAYQALFDVARIRAGESILIHSGAGGTGQAAVQLAKLREATVFVTVGSEEKKRLIMDLYAIPEDHIFSSRGISFTQGVKRMTNNRGVDVVLNSLAGESLEGSWKCLAPFGRFVEIGKKDILNGNKLSMYPFNENRTFSAVNLTHMLSNRPGHIQSIMEAILALANDKKICCPSPLHLYSNARLEEAFRYLQGGQNTGKTILQLNDDDLVPVVPSCRSKYSFRGDKTYLISGGLGGLGRLIARWLVQHKAENLLLLSRSGASGEEAIVFLDELRATGVNVAAPTCDISNKQSLAAVLAEYSVKMPPIKGCIQASMVLQVC